MTAQRQQPLLGKLCRVRFACGLLALSQRSLSLCVAQCAVVGWLGTGQCRGAQGSAGGCWGERGSAGGCRGDQSSAGQCWGCRSVQGGAGVSRSVQVSAGTALQGAGQGAAGRAVPCAPCRRRCVPPCPLLFGLPLPWCWLYLPCQPSPLCVVIFISIITIFSFLSRPSGPSPLPSLARTLWAVTQEELRIQ